MKKILLTIFLMLAICSSAPATVITVGQEAVSGSTHGSGLTVVNQTLKATSSGTVDEIDVYVANVVIGNIIEVGIFFIVSGTNLSTRSNTGNLTVSVGLNSFSAPGDFTALDIETDDMIGSYQANAQTAVNTSGGGGIYFISGDCVPCTNQSFSELDSYRISLYGEGASDDPGGVQDLRFLSPSGSGRILFPTGSGRFLIGG